MTQQFADISSWQPSDPRLDGMQGVFIKTTEGTSYISPNFPAQASAAQSKGLEIGFYHFADGNDAVAEAEFFVNNSQRVNGEAQALDVEANFYNVVTDPVGWCLTWLQKVEELTNNKPGIYLSFAELQAYDWSRVVANGTWLWIAEWNGQNQPEITQFPVWTLWQYADTNISGGDSDVFNGDVDTFKAIAKNSVNPTQPEFPAPVQSNTPNTGETMSEIPVQQLDEIHAFDNEAANTVIAEVRANSAQVVSLVTALTALTEHLQNNTPTVNVDVNALATALAPHITASPIDPTALATELATHLQNTNIDALAAAIVKQIGAKLSA